MSYLTDITDRLATLNLGTAGTNLFQGYLPNDPINSIAVINTGGTAPDMDIPTKSPTFQVLVRNNDFLTGEARLEKVRNELHRIANTTYGSTYFYYIAALSEGGHIGQDEQGAFMFSINFKALTR